MGIRASESVILVLLQQVYRLAETANTKYCLRGLRGLCGSARDGFHQSPAGTLAASAAVFGFCPKNVSQMSGVFAEVFEAQRNGLQITKLTTHSKR